MHRLSTTPPVWELVGASGTVRATTTQLAEWRHGKVKLWDATGQVPELRELTRWAKVCRSLDLASEDVDVDVGDLGTEARQAHEWLDSYLASHRHATVARHRRTGCRTSRPAPGTCSPRTCGTGWV